MKNLDSFFVSPNSTIIEVLKKIDLSGQQIAFVVDSQKTLLGVITDGDIRRFLLNGNKLDSKCLGCMKKEYKFVYIEEITKAKIILDEKLATHIPVLDRNKKILDIYYEDNEVNKELTNPIVFMAGGKGKRLRPHTEYCPKPMLKIGGKPILERLLEKSIKSGFNNFYFSVNYLKNQIIDYFQGGEKWGVKIKYLSEKKPCGTAGSLSLIEDKIDKPLIVVNSDILTGLDYKTLLTFHENNQSSATLCSRNHEVSIPFGVFNSNGIIFEGIDEKPTFVFQINAGIYVINPELLKLVKKDEFLDMTELITRSYSKGYKINICPIFENWLDVGRPETLCEASNNWKKYN
tara:strand:+ start:27452 stop:28492 length:1041 start_codon:yes stop_codon:yes gene_type:complete